MTRTVSRIVIYPIKSLGGVYLDKAFVTPSGLQHDRRYMLIDKQNRFMTVRQVKSMLFMEVTLLSEGIRVNKRGEVDFIDLPLSLTTGTMEKAKIWEDIVHVFIADDKVNQWFSAKIGKDCRLAYLPENGGRSVNYFNDDQALMNLSDEFPMQILGEASVEDLDEKIPEKITTERFRANIVYTGGSAYEEYNFGEIAIGKSLLMGVRPCARCVVTTIDPQTGETGREPLLTLHSQQIEGNMVMGLQAVMLKPGEICLGDEIKINSTKQSPYDPV